MSSGNTVQTVREFFSLLEKGSYKSAISLCSDELVWSMPGSLPGGGLRSKAEIHDLLSQVMSLFVDAPKFEIFKTTSEANRVVVEARADGKLKNGAHYTNAYTFVFEFEAGIIVKVREYLDTARALQILLAP